MSTDAIFTPKTFKFLRELKKNNNRTWFNDNKARYETDVREPMLEFIETFKPYLAKISTRFIADARKSGGSMFRIYRDVRFAKDKSPYKTHLAAQFRHEAGRGDVHAPGFYLHLEPGSVTIGTGIWRPDSKTLRRIRDFIVDNPRSFKKIVNSKALRDAGGLGGAKLQRPPKGFDPEHDLIDYLKHKDFIVMTTANEKTACTDDFVKDYFQRSKKIAPLTEYITQALDLPW